VAERGFDIYPDQIDFMQFLPVSPTATMFREIAYVHPDSRREMRAARYLFELAIIAAEPRGQGTDRARAGRMSSSSYTMGPLSEGEFVSRTSPPDSRKPLRAAPARGWSRE